MLLGRVPDEGRGERSAHRALLRTYLPAQFQHERPLRSLELFLQQLA